MRSYNDGLLNTEIPEEQLVTKYINVDSRDRDRRFFLNTNDYSVNLRHVLYGVRKVELVSAEIPKSEYFLDDNNNAVEILIDPVLFSSSTPLVTEDHMQILRADNALMTSELLFVLRVDAASGTEYGVIQGLLPSVTSSTTKSAPLVFNASRTTHLSSAALFYSNNETALLVAYSEVDSNNGASCRVVILKNDGTVTPSQVSFGSEFGIEKITASDQRSVFQKVVTRISSRKFALLYNSQSTALKVLVGSSGIDKDDVDTRITNGSVFGLDVQEVDHFRVDSQPGVGAYIRLLSCGSYEVRCRMLSVDANYAVTTTSETIVHTSTQLVRGISAAGVGGRILLSYVDHEGLMRVTLLTRLDASLVPIATASFASSNFVGMTGTDGTSNVVDPKTRILWANDSFRTLTVHVRIVDSRVSLVVDDEVFPTLSLRPNETFRFNVRRHPLETQDVSQYLGTLNFYASETTSTTLAGAAATGLGAASVQLTTSSETTLLFYGLLGQPSRGRLSIQAGGTYSLPCYVFTSGAHDVGNQPYTYTSNHVTSRSRGLHTGYQQVGDAPGALAFADSDTSYVLDRGALWTYHGGAWVYLFGGGESSDAPCPRVGATAVVTGDGTLFLFGGIGHANPTTDSVDHENVSFHHDGDDIVVRNIRSSEATRLVEYELSFQDATNSAKITFTNLRGVHEDLVDDGGGWSGLMDLSAFFSETTFGVTITSNQEAEMRYAGLQNPVEFFSTAQGAPLAFESAHANCPSVGGYAFSVLVYPHVDTVDNSGMLGVVYSNVSLRVAAVGTTGSSKQATYTVPVDMWSMVQVDILPTDAFVQGDVSSVSVTVTIDKMLLATGYVGVRDAQFVPTEVRTATLSGTSKRGDGDMLVSLSSSTTGAPVELSSVTLGRGDISPPGYLDDLWSMSLDPYYMSKVAIVTLDEGGAARNSAPTHVTPTALTGEMVHDDVVVAAGYHVRTSLGPVTAGDPLLSDPAMKFDGSSAIRLDASQPLVGQIHSNDYTVSVVARVTPRVGVVVLDSKSSTLVNGVAAGPTVSTQSNVAVTTTTVPPPFQAGSSLLLSPNTHVVFETFSLPESIVLAFFVYVPSNTSGERRLFDLANYLGILVDANNMISVGGAAVQAITTDQWVHCALVSSGDMASLYVDGSSVHTTVATRVVSTALEIGNASRVWTGSDILLSSFCVFDSVMTPSDGADLIAAHRQGCMPSDQCLWSASIPTGHMGVRVTDEAACRCVATLPSGEELSVALTSLTDMQSVLTVCLKRASGITTLTVADASSTLTAQAQDSSSFQLVTSDVLLGAQAVGGGGASYARPLAGRMDEFHIVLGHGLQTVAYATFRWRREDYTIEDDTGFTPQLTPRAHHGMQTDDASNLWIFGGMSSSSTCSDLWVIPTQQRPLVASFLNGSATGTTPPSETHPGSRVHASLMSDGTRLYLFGGEVYEPTGPFTVQADVVKIVCVTGGGGVDGGIVVADYGSERPNAHLYPVFTSRETVLLESSVVVWVSISVDGDEHYVFMIPAENDVYLRTTPSDTLPPLGAADLTAASMWTSTHPMQTPVGVFSDLWSYTIGTAQWEMLNDGTAEAAPGARSRTNAFHTPDDGVVLLTGYYAPQAFAADVWTASEADAWAWIRRSRQDAATPIFATGSTAYPGIHGDGSHKAPAWASASTVSVLMGGNVFTNQLGGLAEEINAHYGLLIHGRTDWSASMSATVSFTRKETFVASSIFPGHLSAQNVSFLGDASFVVQYADRVSYIRVGTPPAPGTAYFPDQIADAGEEVIVVSLVDDPGGGSTPQMVFNSSSALELVVGITYRFRLGGATGSADAITFSQDSQTLQTEVVVQGASTSYVLLTGGLRSGSITIHVGTTASETLSVVEFQSILANYTLTHDDTTQALVHDSVTFESAVPSSLVVNPRFYARLDTAPSAAPEPQACVVLSYQDNANDRHGTTAKLTYSEATNFATSYGDGSAPLVFSASNPTTEIASSYALVGRSVHAFAADGRLQCVLSDAAAVGTPMFANEVSVSGTAIQLLSDEQADLASWFVLFLYQGASQLSGRVIFQRARSSGVDVPVQNTIGETIVYTDPLTLEQADVQRMEMSCFRSGERAGDCIAVYLSGDELLYRDVATADSDPLASTAAPARRTVTFSLLESEGLVSADATAQFKVLTTGVSDGIAGSEILSTFVVVYADASHTLLFRTFSYDANVYIGEAPVTLMTSASAFVLDGVQPGTLGGEDQDGAQQPFDEVTVRIQQAGGFRVLRFSIKSGEVLQDVSIPVDNQNTMSESRSIVVNEHARFVGVSVHTTTSTEAAPITVRSISDTSVTRPSYSGAVTPGDYGVVSSFVDALTRTLQGIDANFSLTYHEGITKLEIANAFSPFRILLSGAVQAPRNIEACLGLAYIIGYRDFNDIVSQYVDGAFKTTSLSRLDLKGRQYLYMYLSVNGYYISDESSSRNKQNAFGRIVLAADKGEVMYFMNSHYQIEAKVSINILNTLTVQLGRFSQLTNDDMDGSRDMLLYEPQGVEHSFCLKVTCMMDKQGSTAPPKRIRQLPERLLAPPSYDYDAPESDDGDTDYFQGGYTM